jgi:hypothetical protein
LLNKHFFACSLRQLNLWFIYIDKFWSNIGATIISEQAKTSKKQAKTSKKQAKNKQTI